MASKTRLRSLNRQKVFLNGSKMTRKRMTLSPKLWFSKFTPFHRNIIWKMKSWGRKMIQSGSWTKSTKNEPLKIFNAHVINCPHLAFQLKYTTSITIDFSRTVGDYNVVFKMPESWVYTMQHFFSQNLRYIYLLSSLGSLFVTGA